MVAALARSVAALHAAGAVAGGLHPRLVYADERGFTGFAVRHEALWTAAASEFARPLLAPTFFAPERVCAGAAPTPAGDVFALGALLAWLASGVAPFGTAVTDELRAHLTGTGPQGVPAPLAPLLHEVLAKDPAARPSAAEFAATLEAW